MKCFPDLLFAIRSFWTSLSLMTYMWFFNLLILERERWGGEREKGKHQFVVPLIYTFFADSCMCPDWGLNPQPWRIGMML